MQTDKKIFFEKEKFGFFFFNEGSEVSVWQPRNDHQIYRCSASLHVTIFSKFSAVITYTFFNNPEGDSLGKKIFAKGRIKLYVYFKSQTRREKTRQQ